MPETAGAMGGETDGLASACMEWATGLATLGGARRASVAERRPKVTRSVRRASLLPMLLLPMLLLLIATGTGAAAAPVKLQPAGETRVVGVVNGATVQLGTGDTARLAGVDAPRLQPRDGRLPPHAEASRGKRSPRSSSTGGSASSMPAAEPTGTAA